MSLRRGLTERAHDPSPEAAGSGAPDPFGNRLLGALSGAQRHRIAAVIDVVPLERQQYTNLFDAPMSSGRIERLAVMDATIRARYPGGNQLIDGLPAADRDEVVSRLTSMAADETSGGISRGERINAAYFPIDAVFSVLVELTGGDCYEVDTVGRAGFIGGELLFGADVAARSVICQIAGDFAQMPFAAFEDCFARIPSFAAAVHRGMLLQWYRAQQTVACNFAHTPSERCARWTLLTREAVGRPEFPFRAEYLAMMLGVQSNVVTEPMAALQSLGALRYAGEVVTVVSEHRLRDAACECYTAPLAFEQRLAQKRASTQRTTA